MTGGPSRRGETRESSAGGSPGWGHDTDAGETIINECDSGGRMDVKPGAAYNAPTLRGEGLNPSDGLEYGLPYPTAAPGRKVSRYRVRTWRRKMMKRIRQRIEELARLVGE